MLLITKETNIEEVVTTYPYLVKVFIAHGLPCLVCGEPFWGTIDELAQKHNVDVAPLINELNEKKTDR